MIECIFDVIFSCCSEEERLSAIEKTDNHGNSILFVWLNNNLLAEEDKMKEWKENCLFQVCSFLYHPNMEEEKQEKALTTLLSNLKRKNYQQTLGKWREEELFSVCEMILLLSSDKLLSKKENNLFLLLPKLTWPPLYFWREMYNKLKLLPFFLEEFGGSNFIFHLLKFSNWKALLPLPSISFPPPTLHKLLFSSNKHNHNLPLHELLSLSSTLPDNHNTSSPPSSLHLLSLFDFFFSFQIQILLHKNKNEKDCLDILLSSSPTQTPSTFSLKGSSEDSENGSSNNSLSEEIKFTDPLHFQTNQQINQQTNQQISQQTNQQISQPINQPINQQTNQPTNQPINQQTNQIHQQNLPQPKAFSVLCKHLRESLSRLYLQLSLSVSFYLPPPLSSLLLSHIFPNKLVFFIKHSPL